jgi:hypothetical protein
MGVYVLDRFNTLDHTELDSFGSLECPSFDLVSPY